MISYVMPTRDRPEALWQTLAALEALGDHAEIGGAEVIVADNASTPAVCLPERLRSGVPVRVVRRTSNEGAAARNAAAEATHPASAWIVMLDDDSAPLDLGLSAALRAAPAEAAAVAAEIFLPAVGGAMTREQGGLPEVFVGCGVALRREVFLGLGGYDPAFNYYVEEYDLAARIIQAGWRVTLDRRFRVLHRKVAAGRDMNTILARLVRNNGWVLQRYAPAGEVRGELRRMRRRYWEIAQRENARHGFDAGLAEWRGTRSSQFRRPLRAEEWDRFTGRAGARWGLLAEYAREPFGTAAVVARGKHAEHVERVLKDLGVDLVAEADAEVRVIGTLAPGPMLDAYDALVGTPGPRVVRAWLNGGDATSGAFTRQAA